MFFDNLRFCDVQSRFQFSSLDCSRPKVYTYLSCTLPILLSIIVICCPCVPWVYFRKTYCRFCKLTWLCDSYQTWYIYYLCPTHGTFITSLKCNSRDNPSLSDHGVWWYTIEMSNGWSNGTLSIKDRLNKRQQFIQNQYFINVICTLKIVIHIKGWTFLWSNFIYNIWFLFRLYFNTCFSRWDRLFIVLWKVCGKLRTIVLTINDIVHPCSFIENFFIDKDFSV